MEDIHDDIEMYHRERRRDIIKMSFKLRIIERLKQGP